VAVVTTFVPVMLSRNVQDYRPRLVLRDGALQAVPPATGFLAGLRLRDLFVNELPYMSDARLRESTELTAAVLRETARAARAHGAEPIFAVFSIGPRRELDQHAEAPVVRALFIDQRLPFALIDVHQPELVPYDGHPGPQAHRRIANVLAAALRARLSHAQ
jgi:hypothetical protein